MSSKRCASKMASLTSTYTRPQKRLTYVLVRARTATTNTCEQHFGPKSVTGHYVFGLCLIGLSKGNGTVRTVDCDDCSKCALGLWCTTSGVRLKDTRYQLFQGKCVRCSKEGIFVVKNLLSRFPEVETREQAQDSLDHAMLISMAVAYAPTGSTSCRPGKSPRHLVCPDCAKSVSRL